MIEERLVLEVQKPQFTSDLVVDQEQADQKKELLYSEQLQEVRANIPCGKDLSKDFLYTSATDEISDCLSQISQDSSSEFPPIFDYLIRNICTEEEFSLLESYFDRLPQIKSLVDQKLEAIKKSTAEVLGGINITTHVSRLTPSFVLLGPASHNCVLTHTGDYHYSTSASHEYHAYGIFTSDIAGKSKASEPPVPQSIYIARDYQPLEFIPENVFEKDIETSGKIGVFGEMTPVFISFDGTFYYGDHYSGADISVVTSEKALLISQGRNTIFGRGSDSEFFKEEDTTIKGTTTRIPSNQEPVVILLHEADLDRFKQYVSLCTDPDNFFNRFESNISVNLEDNLSSIHKSIDNYGKLIPLLQQLKEQFVPVNLETKLQQMIIALTKMQEILKPFEETSLRIGRWMDITSEEIGDTQKLIDEELGDGISLLFANEEQQISLFTLQELISEAHLSPSILKSCSDILENFRLDNSSSFTVEHPKSIIERASSIVFLRTRMQSLRRLRNYFRNAEKSPFKDWAESIGENGEHLDEWIEQHVLIKKGAWQEEKQAYSQEFRNKIITLLEAQQAHLPQKRGIVLETAQYNKEISSITRRTFIPARNTVELSENMCAN